jgi:membrane protein
MSTKLKYIDSHWGIFALQGVVALLFGWFALFTNSSDIQTLVIVVGSVLLSLGIIELLNLLARARTKNTWGVSLVMAILEISAGLALLFTYEQNVAWHLIVIAAYTILRGIFEIILGLKAIDDLTDKFIWILAGVCACIMGVVILNTGHLGTIPFIKYFGSYMMVFGVVNLIYSVHNNEQGKDYRSEKLVAKKKISKTLELKTPVSKTTTKTVKKTAKKTTKKA